MMHKGVFALCRESQEIEMKRNQRGFSLIELLIVVAIIGIIAAIAIPNLLRSRQLANEASAISSVRTVGTAQSTFQSTDGNGKEYAESLRVLADADLIDSTLGSGAKSGYSFECAGTLSFKGEPSLFDTTAVPQSSGTFGTGNRAFYANESFVVYESVSLLNGGKTPSARTDRSVQDGNPID